MPVMAVMPARTVPGPERLQFDIGNAGPDLSCDPSRRCRLSAVEEGLCKLLQAPNLRIERADTIAANSNGRGKRGSLVHGYLPMALYCATIVLS